MHCRGGMRFGLPAGKGSVNAAACALKGDTIIIRNHTLRWTYLFRARRLSTSMMVMSLTAGISCMVMLFWASTPVLAQEAVSQKDFWPRFRYAVVHQ